MNMSQEIDVINTIEAKFPVDEWVVDGIHVWPIIRINLSFKFQFYNSKLRDKKDNYGILDKALVEMKGFSRYLYAYCREIGRAHV